MKKIALMAAVSVMAIIGAGCSVLQPEKTKNPKTMSGNSATKIEKKGPSSSAASAIGEGGAAMKNDSVAMTIVQAPVSTALARNIGGEWSIIMVNGVTIDRDEGMPYITFEPSKSFFYANNGCNTVNGSYSLNAADEVTFFNVLTTMRYCADVKFDNMINTIIADNVSTKLRMSEVGQETFVDFLGEGGKTIMRLRRGNLDFLNGQWNVESIAGVDKLKVPADVFFDLAELKLHGNTGCNFVNGTIYLDHRRANAVDFSNMGTTRMACPYTSQETAFLVALEQTVSAVSDGSDKVLFLDENGKVLMTLRREVVKAE